MASYVMRDLAGAFADIRLWGMITAKSLQVKYRRNALGILWLLFSFAIPTVGIGYVLAMLQGEALTDHMPHVALGFAAWNYVSDTLIHGCKALTRRSSMLLQAPINRSVFALSTIMEHLMVLGMNLVAAVVISLVFGWRPGPEVIFLPISILIMAVAGFGTVMLVSILSARLRDLSELIASVTRLAFFFTPVIWVADSRAMPEGSFLSVIADYNPIAYYVDLFREPLMGQYPDMLTLIITGGGAVVLLVAGMVAIQKGGRSIAFFV